MGGTKYGKRGPDTADTDDPGGPILAKGRLRRDRPIAHVHVNGHETNVRINSEEGGHGHVMHALRKLSAYLLWKNVWESFQMGSPFS